MLEDPGGGKLIKGRRRTGFLGLLGTAQTVERIYTFMETGQLCLMYFACYKICQDFIEIFFNAVRSSNGWSYNPTPRQFRFKKTHS
jgi:hypothetical protein